MIEKSREVRVTERSGKKYANGALQVPRAPSGNLPRKINSTSCITVLQSS